MPIRITLPSIPTDDFAGLFESLKRSLTVLKVGKVTYKIPDSEIHISMDGKSSRITKGKLIWNRIQEIVESGEYVSREIIANECESTVSRIAEILKEKSDSPIAQKYRRMAAEERMQRSLSREIEKENRHASLIEILNEEYEKEKESNERNA